MANDHRIQSSEGETPAGPASDSRPASPVDGGIHPARPEDPSLAHLAEHVSANAESSAAPDGEAFSLADDPELIADFIQEASEHLASVENLTLILEQSPDDKESLNALFRSFHSIKGLAGFLELHAIRELAHQVETLLDQARNGETRIGTDAIDCILASADFFRRGVDALSARLRGDRAPLPPLDQALCDAVIVLFQTGSPAVMAVADPADEDAQDFADAVDPTLGIHPEADAGSPGAVDPAVTALAVRTPGEALASAARPAASPVPATNFAPTDQSKAPANVSAAEQAQRKSAAGGSVKVETAKLDYLVDMVGEFVIAQSIVRHDPDLHLAENPRLQRNFAQLARITAEIQRSAMSMRMVPIQGLFQRMARLVRDLARKTGKDVDFVSVGEETELDRTLIEQLADPLMHMVRNSLDHGVEGPAERLRAGKSPRGKVQLRAGHESGGIIIEISDDGRGLNREKILGRSIERGLLSPNANPPDTEVWGLIFEPGFSTAEKVTDISGRGVGMDVVRRNIQQLRGRIDISSVTGQGARVCLRLPLTLAIIDALLVGAGQDRFIIPMYTVREMFRPAPGAVTMVRASSEDGGGGEVVEVRGKLVPIRRLDRVLGVRSRARRAEDGLLVVLETQSGSFCLLVDEFLGKQEVVIKPLGATFRHVSGISAGAILGDGKVALILDVDSLKHASTHTPLHASVAQGEPGRAEQLHA